MTFLENRYYGVIVIASIFLCFLVFSSNGYFIGDQGLTLATAQRLLNGQLPHLDFISIRPVFTLYFWAMIIEVFGNYTFLASRCLLWAQFSLITVLWISIFESTFEIKLKQNTKVIFYFLGLMLTSNFIILEAWYNTDALMLASAGIWLIRKNGVCSGCVGFIVAGLSVLSKQSYIGIFPLLWMFNRNWKQGILQTPLFFVGFFLNSIWLKSIGAYDDYVIQLSSFIDPIGFLMFGVKSYLLHKATWRGFILGCLFFFLLPRFVKNEKWLKWLSVMFAMLAFFYGALFFIQGHYSTKNPYFLWGIVMANLVYTISHKKGWLNLSIPLVIVLFTFITSASLGYWYGFNTNGILGLYLLFIFIKRFSDDVFHRMLVVLLIVTTPAWWYFRQNNIFGERPANELTFKLDGLLPAGSGIYTNKFTYEALKSIHHLTSEMELYSFAIVPDFSAFWVNSKFKNPLPIDWAYAAEIPNRQVSERIVKSIVDKEPGFTVFLHKNHYLSYSMANKMPFKRREYTSAYISAIYENYSKLSEDEYFEVWKRK